MGSVSNVEPVIVWICVDGSKNVFKRYAAEPTCNIIIYYLFRCHIIREKSTWRCSRIMFGVCEMWWRWFDGREPVPLSTNFHCIRININKIDSQTQTNAISSRCRLRRRCVHIIYFCWPLKCLPNVLSNFDGQACRLCQLRSFASLQIHMRYRDIVVWHFS